jgi:hypothetical protein
VVPISKNGDVQPFDTELSLAHDSLIGTYIRTFKAMVADRFMIEQNSKVPLRRFRITENLRKKRGDDEPVFSLSNAKKIHGVLFLQLLVLLQRSCLVRTGFTKSNGR